MDPSPHLPVKPHVFHLLLALLDGPSHGYALMGAVAASTNGAVSMLPGQLYRHLQRMLEDGLIREAVAAGSEGDDPRRRYYELTPLGRRVTEAEAVRLAAVVDLARKKRLVGGQSSSA